MTPLALSLALSGTAYTPAQLGLTTGATSGSIYVEGINPGMDTIEININIDLDADGTADHTDNVKVTVISVTLLPDQGDFIDDRDNNINSKIFIHSVEDTGVITVTASTNPAIEEEDLPSDWNLTGGIGNSKLVRTIDKTVPHKEVITLTYGGLTHTCTIYVYEIEFGLYADGGGSLADLIIGHAWWSFHIDDDSRELFRLPQFVKYLTYVNEEFGWGPNNNIWTPGLLGPWTGPGWIWWGRGDPPHVPTGQHKWRITFDDLILAASYVDVACQTGNSYDLLSINCTDMAVWVAEEAGIQTIDASGDFTEPGALSDWLNEQNN